MSDAWTIAAAPEALTIPVGETRRMAFTVTNLDERARLAELDIVPDPGTAHSSWFTVDPPSIVLSGRSATVGVQVTPRVATLEPGDHYTFGFHGQVDSAVSGSVSVTVTGPTRWQVTVAPQLLEVQSSGGYLVVFTVTNLLADPATALLEAPYTDPGTLILAATPARYHLDEGQKVVPGFASTAFTLRVDVPNLLFTEVWDTVQARVTAVGEGDAVFSPPVGIHYWADQFVPTITKSPGWRVTGPGQWQLPERPL